VVRGDRLADLVLRIAARAAALIETSPASIAATTLGAPRSTTSKKPASRHCERGKRVTLLV
jgi:hypothetical protein